MHSSGTIDRSGATDKTWARLFFRTVAAMREGSRGEKGPLKNQRPDTLPGGGILLLSGKNGKGDPIFTEAKDSGIDRSQTPGYGEQY